jgi:hypothetical protein
MSMKIRGLPTRTAHLGSGRRRTMRGLKFIDGASFGPEALKTIGQAFDEAWIEIAGNFGNIPVEIDNARYQLANALLSICNEDSRDVEVLKRAALLRLTLDYRSR